MTLFNQKHATPHRCWVRIYYYEWVSLLFVDEDAFKTGVVEVVQILSTRYIEDVDVKVQCEGMIRMDKIKTKISRFRVSSQAISRLRHSLDIHMSYY